MESATLQSNHKNVRRCGQCIDGQETDAALSEITVKAFPGTNPVNAVVCKVSRNQEEEFHKISEVEESAAKIEPFKLNIPQLLIMMKNQADCCGKFHRIEWIDTLSAVQNYSLL